MLQISKKIETLHEMRIFAFCLLLLVLGTSKIMGQSKIQFADTNLATSRLSYNITNRPKKEVVALVPLLEDTTHYYTRAANGLIVMPSSNWTPFPDNVSFRDTVIYNPAYLPVVFDGQIIPSNLDFVKREEVKNNFHLIQPQNTFVPLIQKSEEIQELRRDFYTNMNNMNSVRYSASLLKNITKFNEKEVTKRNILNELITVEEPIKVAPKELPKVAPEYIYWLKHGEHSLQIAQNYLSENWYKGGNSSFFIRNDHKFMLNYKRDKIIFNNTLEWRLHLQQTPADKEHNFNISEDLFRLENTFGYKAYDKWSYSAIMETKTQLFNTYPINSDNKNLAFLSPLVVNLGIGVNYNLDKKYMSDKTRRLKLSQNIAPLSLNYIYLNDTTVTKRSGVEVGDNSKIEFGSLINTTLTFNFNRYMTWTSRFKYFTNYERAEMEFENKFDMALNRFLSTSIFLYMRFDDNATYEKNIGYFQVNELISFGLNYKW